MTSNQKKQHNYDNELNYHYAPFTPQRAEIRKEWSGTRKCWDSFLYDKEKNIKIHKITKN